MREGMFIRKEIFAQPETARATRRVDDRRVVSRIINVLQGGIRWRDCPQRYGPATMLYNRWRRWSRKGLWKKMFYE